MTFEEELDSLLPVEFKNIINFLVAAGGNRESLDSIIGVSFSDDPARALSSTQIEAYGLGVRLSDELFEPAYALAVKANEQYGGIEDWIEAIIAQGRNAAVQSSLPEDPRDIEQNGNRR